MKTDRLDDETWKPRKMYPNKWITQIHIKSSTRTPTTSNRKLEHSQELRRPHPDSKNIRKVSSLYLLLSLSLDEKIVFKVNS